jgi:ferritin-like metal-binding protein YciE
MATEADQIASLRDLFEYELEQMYYVENELVDALAMMADEVTNDKMREGFKNHLEETERHVERLERVFDAIGAEPRMRESETYDGLMADKRSFESHVADDELRNVHHLSAGMKTEHVEITRYQSLLTLADKLDLGSDVTDPLEDNLDSEERTLKELEAMSEGSELKSMLDKLL